MTGRYFKISLSTVFGSSSFGLSVAVKVPEMNKPAKLVALLHATYIFSRVSFRFVLTTTHDNEDP